MSNQAAYSPAPNIISLVSNAVSPTNWPAPGNTPYSFAVARIPEDPNGPDGPIDFIVDGYGNTGLGVMDPASKFHIFNTTGNHPGNIPNSVQVDRQKFEYIGSGPGYNITTYNDFMITSDGLIGVGVSAPSAHLDIADQNNDGQPLLRVSTYAGADAALYIDHTGVMTVGGSSTTGTGLSGTVLKIKGAGYCEGSFYAQDLLVSAHLWMSAGAASGYVLQSDALGNASWVDPNSLANTVWGQTGNNIYNLNTGQVRLGPSSGFTSYAKLQVHDDIAIDLVNPNTTGWGSIIQFYDNSGNVRHRIYDDFGPTTSGGTSSTTGDLVIDPMGGKLAVTGGVKIGNLPAITSAMDNKYMLYVEKGILTEKVKVALTAAGNWSDYVFDKDYKLRKLEDVQAYIKEYHHLPDVPSAKDVYNDGIDMAQMDATFLRKIEELTLYVLDLKKENEEIKKQLKQSK